MKKHPGVQYSGTEESKDTKSSMFIINGGYKLHGEVSLLGGKNTVLPLICATLLTKESCIIKDVPKISDVRNLLKILKLLGSKIEHITKDDIRITNRNLVYTEDIFKYIEKLRGSVLLLAPFIIRFKNFKFKYPGGDRIGSRELSAHFKGFEALGACVSFYDDYFEVSLTHNPRGSDIFLYEPSVTATENLIMLASLSQGTTVIENSACEPHVVELSKMLVSMGAKIEGIGTNVLKIQGVEKLKGTEYAVIKDIVEIVTYIVFALMSDGDITILDTYPQYMKSIFYVFLKFNIKIDIIETSQNKFNIHVPSNQNMYLRSDLGFNNLGIYTHPYPGFPTDLLSLFIVLATKVKGDILFFEKMYENRLRFVMPLKVMGAKFEFIDNNRIIVKGGVELKGSLNLGSNNQGSKTQGSKSNKSVSSTPVSVVPVLNVPDIRAGVAYIAAALGAKGESEVYNVEHIDRGYPHIEKTLQSLGASIERIKGF
ncbi:MAG: UDP-N-acetylglucosamine 1-carboxyvinyltransferase [Patescibacteria group bacterium]